MDEFYQGYTYTGWARLSATTLAQHLTDIENATMREHPFLLLLQNNGLIKYNDYGNGFDWSVKFRKPDVQGFDGENPIDFKSKNIHKKAKLEWRGYVSTETMSEKEFLANRDQAAIVKTFDNMINELTESMEQFLPTECFKDGSAAGNEHCWHGFETMYGYDGTLNVTTGEQRTANAADIVAYPSGTYAGISTELGEYGGDQRLSPNGQAAVWPNYVADPEFDFWSPLIVNYNSTAFSAQTHDWVNQGHEAVSYAITHAQRNQNMKEHTTQAFMARNLWQPFTTKIRDKERIAVTSSLALRSLGFTNTIEWDGCEFTWDNAVPQSECYGIPLKLCQLRCMRSKLLYPEGPIWNFEKRRFQAAVTTLSNLRFKSPRNFWKTAPLTS